MSTKPIKLVINTHAHADHFGANELMAQGGTIAAEEKMLSLSDDKTRIVADEGDPASTADLKASRDALVMIKARVRDVITRMAYQSLKGASSPAR